MKTATPKYTIRIHSGSLAICGIAFAFGIIQTWLFGWNWTPQSTAERVCDGITVLLTAAGLLANFHIRVYEREA